MGSTLLYQNIYLHCGSNVQTTIASDSRWEGQKWLGVTHYGFGASAVIFDKGLKAFKSLQFYQRLSQQE